METIKIQSKKEINHGFEMEIVVGDGSDTTRHTVTVYDDYVNSLNIGDCTLEKLLSKSFEFLLAREPKTSILSSFNLSVIEDYFSEYKPVIKKMIEQK